MSFTCTICQNHFNSQHFVRLYEDLYEEIYKDNLFREKTEFTYVHPICASFFLETELIVLISGTNPCLLNSSGNKIVTEAIFCNFKEILKHSQENCQICISHSGHEVLIPCAAR